MKQFAMNGFRLLRSVLSCTLPFATGAGAYNMPEPGVPAPEFSLLSQAGTRVSLKAYKGSWVILFFFGDHSTPDLDLYAHNFERDMAKYASYHAVVIGGGGTSPESDSMWAKKIGVSFPLLSDPDQKVAAAYGVPADGSNGLSDGGIYHVIIAPDGTVRLPGIVTNDVDGSSTHMLACLEYFKDQQK